MGCRPPGGDVRTTPLDEGLGSDPSPEASGLRRQEVGSGQEAGLNATCTGCDRPWGRRRHPTAILVREGREARLTPRSQGPCDPSRLHPSLGFTASSAPCSIKGDIPPITGAWGQEANTGVQSARRSLEGGLCLSWRRR